MKKESRDLVASTGHLCLEEYFPNFLVKDVSRQPGKADILVVSLRQHKFMIEVKNRDSSNVPQSEIDRFKNNLASSPDVRAGILLSLKSGIVNKAKTGKFQVTFLGSFNTRFMCRMRARMEH